MSANQIYSAEKKDYCNGYFNDLTINGVVSLNGSGSISSDNLTIPGFLDVKGLTTLEGNVNATVGTTTLKSLVVTDTVTLPGTIGTATINNLNVPNVLNSTGTTNATTLNVSGLTNMSGNVTVGPGNFTVGAGNITSLNGKSCNFVDQGQFGSVACNGNLGAINVSTQTMTCAGNASFGTGSTVTTDNLTVNGTLSYSGFNIQIPDSVDNFTVNDNLNVGEQIVTQNFSASNVATVSNDSGTATLVAQNITSTFIDNGEKITTKNLESTNSVSVNSATSVLTATTVNVNALNYTKLPTPELANITGFYSGLRQIQLYFFKVGRMVTLQIPAILVPVAEQNADEGRIIISLAFNNDLIPAYNSIIPVLIQIANGVNTFNSIGVIELNTNNTSIYITPVGLEGFDKSTEQSQGLPVGTTITYITNN